MHVECGLVKRTMCLVLFYIISSVQCCKYVGPNHMLEYNPVRQFKAWNYTFQMKMLMNIFYKSVFI